VLGIWALYYNPKPQTTNHQNACLPLTCYLLAWVISWLIHGQWLWVMTMVEVGPTRTVTFRIISTFMSMAMVMVMQ
jgi:hypothetical protein